MTADALAWLCRVDEPALLAAVPAGIRELGPGELARLRRLRMPHRRRQFLTGHVLARLAVRQWLVESGLEGAGWSLDQAADGRPELRVAAAGPAGVGLSIAHSGDRVAVLVAPVAGCGVDVEAGPVSPYLTGLMLEAREHAELPQADRALAARRRWVLREAYAKASGAPLDEVPRAVLGGGGSDDRVRGVMTAGGRRWEVHAWQHDGAHLAAVWEAGADRGWGAEAGAARLVVRAGLDRRADAVPM